ncbi:hypothetical protein K378_01367 [Streptomyces sp. Amel2xB2]|uniref:hypothetical protein n=1 Tax=Streptomyces sp. Amel2xB2 TaxID=1305829 RepID=UPI000DC015F3|nr:hypothetical protein [Streptomyces sp. Amel2xB2]RAJ70202.1 hypothetical protein K378_01367 [Streptomyces sp. Amel2xB2]
MTASFSATERTAIQVGKTALRTSAHPCSDIVEQVVAALSDAGLLAAEAPADTAVEPHRALALPDGGAS